MPEDRERKLQQGPLEGILVVSIEQAVAAPLCSCRLAEAGARVIKIERAEGDFARAYDNVVNGDSAYFVWANHGKESLQLDIKNADDIALLHRILRHADVFIQNLAPGALTRVALGSEMLRQQYPRLITCDISGYGDTGPYQYMKAYDFLVQCESGLVSISGAPEAEGRIGVSLCDIGAGMNALIGIQQALIKRANTGFGSGVKVSLFDTATDWMNVPYMHAVYGGKSPQRLGLHHPSIAPYGGYLTADGETLVISIQNEREWWRFCDDILEQPELKRDGRFSHNNARVANRLEMDDIINGVFSGLTRAAMAAKLKQADIAFGALNSVEQLAEHPQLRKLTVMLSNGEQVEIIAPPVQLTGIEIDHRLWKVPVTGEHSEKIRMEFSKDSVSG